MAPGGGRRDRTASIQTGRFFMNLIRRLSAVALLVTATFLALGGDVRPAWAGDSAGAPVFPPGARVGMTPLIGLQPAKTFPGFETEDHSVKVVVGEFPPEAYGEVEKSFKADPDAKSDPKSDLKSDPKGIKPEIVETSAGKAYYTIETVTAGPTKVRRYSMILKGSTFSGYVAVQVPENAGKIYTDDAVRKMFASAVIRNEVPVDEQLAQMPFKITELSAFKNVRTLAPGAAIILADGDEVTGFEPAPFMVIGMVSSAPAEPEERERFAQRVAATIPGIRDARVTASEPMRIEGTPGYETRIDATSGKDNTAVTVVQWLRFGNSTALRIIGSAPRDQWAKAFPRFRAVRDGIQTR